MGTVLRRPDLGTLTASNRADFVVLTADPLTTIANAQAIDVVVKDGLRFDASELKTQ